MCDDYEFRYDGWMQHQRGRLYAPRVAKVPASLRGPRSTAGETQRRTWHERFRCFPLAVRQRIKRALAIVVGCNERASARVRRAA